MSKSAKINGPFAPRTIEMLRSPAFRVLSLSGRRILDRLEIELGTHGGKDNGALPVTFADLEQYGISDRHSIGRGIREVCALGFVQMTRRGRAGNSKYRTASLFRLTYLPADHAPPTDEWKQIATVEEADRIARKARQNRRPRKHFPVVETTPLPVVETTPLPVVETTPTAPNPHFPSGGNHTTI